MSLGCRVKNDSLISWMLLLETVTYERLVAAVKSGSSVSSLSRRRLFEWGVPK